MLEFLMMRISSAIIKLLKRKWLSTGKFSSPWYFLFAHSWSKVQYTVIIKLCPYLRIKRKIPKTLLIWIFDSQHLLYSTVKTQTRLDGERFHILILSSYKILYLPFSGVSYLTLFTVSFSFQVKISRTMDYSWMANLPYQYWIFIYTKIILTKKCFVSKYIFKKIKKMEAMFYAVFFSLLERLCILFHVCDDNGMMMIMFFISWELLSLSQHHLWGCGAHACCGTPQACCCGKNGCCGITFCEQ